MDDLKRAVRRYADQHADSEGFTQTAVAGVRLMRFSAPRGPMPSIYRPLVCMVLQGVKEVTVGSHVQHFTPGRSAIVGVDLPVVGRVLQASSDEPYLAISIELDWAILQEVAAELTTPVGGSAPTGAPLFIEGTDDAALDCARRLMKVADSPRAARVLRPAIMRELYFWLLSGEHGAAMRQIAQPNGHARRIARVIELMRAEFPAAIPVERLADVAGMSQSAFFRSFKALTLVSPLQFQKRLRLIEARRLMATNGLAATQAAFEVGYESVSQFTREYHRMFGAPPRRHVSDAAPQPAALTARTARFSVVPKKPDGPAAAHRVSSGQQPRPADLASAAQAPPA